MRIEPLTTMSSIILLEKPETMFPTIKIPMHRQSMAFRPNMSENRPYNGWHTIEVSKLTVGMKYATEPEVVASVESTERLHLRLWLTGIESGRNSRNGS